MSLARMEKPLINRLKKHSKPRQRDFELEREMINFLEITLNQWAQHNQVQGKEKMSYSEFIKSKLETMQE